MQTRKCNLLHKFKAAATKTRSGFFYYFKLAFTLIARRPAITILFLLTGAIIALNCFGFFLPERNSCLVHLAKYNQNITIEGTVASYPIVRANYKQFVLKTKLVDGLPVSEKVLVTVPSGYSFSYGDTIAADGYLTLPQSEIFPNTFNYRQYLSGKSIYTLFKADFMEFVSAQKGFNLKAFSFKLRAHVIEKIETYFKPPYSNVMKAIFAGEASGLDRQTKSAFQDSGLVHVLVVSGLHVGYFALIVFVILRACYVPYRWAALIAIPLLFMYGFMTGGAIPVMRSCIMSSVVLLSVALRREPLIYNALALSAVIILLINPKSLFSASMQMSYAATIGIIAFYGYFYKMFAGVKNKIWKYAAGLFCVAIAAELTITPLIMYYFGRVSVISIPANVILLPGLAVMVIAGFVFAVFSFTWGFAAGITAWVLSKWLWVMLTAVKFVSSFAYSAVYVIKPDILQLVFFYLFIFTIPVIKNLKIRARIMEVIVAVSFLYALGLYNTPAPNYLEIFNKGNMYSVNVNIENQNTVILFDTGKIRNIDLRSFKDYLTANRFKNLKVYVITDDAQKIKQRLDLNKKDIYFASGAVNDRNVKAFDSGEEIVLTISIGGADANFTINKQTYLSKNKALKISL
jgi:competence protein ComEC